MAVKSCQCFNMALFILRLRAQNLSAVTPADINFPVIIYLKLQFAWRALLLISALILYPLLVLTKKWNSTSLNFDFFFFYCLLSSHFSSFMLLSSIMWRYFLVCAYLICFVNEFHSRGLLEIYSRVWVCSAVVTGLPLCICEAQGAR